MRKTKIERVDPVMTEEIDKFIMRSKALGIDVTRRDASRELVKELRLRRAKEKNSEAKFSIL